MTERSLLAPPDGARPDAAPDTVRRGLAARLPDLIETAFRRYQTFAAIDPPGEAKAFAAYCAACRAAVQHLDQLLKLLRALDGEPDASVPDDDIERLIARAEAALDDAVGGSD